VLARVLKTNINQVVVKKMKKLWFALAALTLSSGLSQAQECPTLIITGPPAGAPASWVKEGKLIGAATELVESLALKAGAKKVETRVFATWAEALAATYKGEVDAIFSAGWSEERARYLDYVQPSFGSQFLYVLVKRNNAFQFQKFEDLLGRKGAATLGETYGDGTFGEFVRKDLKLERAPELSKVIDLLLEDKVEFIFAYENAAYSQMMIRNLGTKLQTLPAYPTRAETFIAFSKRSKCSGVLRKRLSEQVALANTNHTYRKLLSDYREVFNESLTRPN
jgi:polar amino acid transport system substrate-binding protein